uniref:Uncharacterized protein n=1 Tax=Setaria italica TaxID=4555 RepID=K4A4G1_SETIT
MRVSHVRVEPPLPIFARRRRRALPRRAAGLRPSPRFSPPFSLPPPLLALIQPSHPIRAPSLPRPSGGRRPVPPPPPPMLLRAPLPSLVALPVERSGGRVTKPP